MATARRPLIWKIVKKNNSFPVKQFCRGSSSFQFSKESHNLYNLNSYKYSGLANKKTVTIQPGGKDPLVVLVTTKRRQNKPANLIYKSLVERVPQDGQGRSKPALETLTPTEQ